MTWRGWKRSLKSDVTVLAERSFIMVEAQRMVLRGCDMPSCFIWQASLLASLWKIKTVQTVTEMTLLAFYLREDIELFLSWTFWLKVFFRMVQVLINKKAVLLYALISFLTHSEFFTMWTQSNREDNIFFKCNKSKQNSIKLQKKAPNTHTTQSYSLYMLLQKQILYIS